MILWIFIAAIIIAFILGTIWDGLSWGLLSAISTAMVCFLVLIVVLLICGVVDAKTDIWGSRKDTHSLTALQTSSSIEGRSLFLGGGYIDGKRVLNYIQKDDDAFYVKSSDADDSVIHESTGKPKVVHSRVDSGAWWLFPFPMLTTDKYDFYVPKGSVLSDYTVNNN